jgi:acyl carrier protein
MTNAELSNNILEGLEPILRRQSDPRKRQHPLHADTNLADDLGVDSPRLIDIVLEIEDRFGIRIEDDESARLVRLGDLVNLIQTKTAAVQG